MSQTCCVAPVLQTATAGVSSPRLASLDALRGFDMFWITGGSALIAALAKYTNWSWMNVLATQMEHVEWNGFRFYDMIFPLFLFISGVTLPWSMARRLAAGERKSTIYLQVARRVVILILLGLVVNGILKFDFANQRYAGVLARIGIAYGLAAVIVLNCRLRGQVIWMVGLLLAYWAAMMLIPVPGFGRGNLSMEGSLVGYIDRTFLPGRLYLGVHDPEGLFSTIPAISTALLGVMVGHWLKSSASPMRKVGMLALAGVVCLGLGWIWNLSFPINKNLWSSSFVLFAGGWSILLLTLFYLLIDVWQLKRWAFFFVIIGMNPITIYIFQRFINFRFAADQALGGLGKKLFSESFQPVWASITLIVMEWLFLYCLYRKKVFLRV